MNAYESPRDPLDALGHGTRRAIVAALRDGELTVGAIAAGLPVSRPAVSQHLAILREAGLVVERAAGTRRYYRLDPTGLVRLHGLLDAMWGVDAAVPPAGGAPGAGSPPDAPAVGEASLPDGKGGRKKRRKKGGRR